METIIYNQIFSQLKPGDTYTLHIGKDTYEFIYPISGMIKIYKNQRQFEPSIFYRSFLNQAIAKTIKDNIKLEKHNNPDKFMKHTQKINRMPRRPITQMTGFYQHNNMDDNRDASYMGILKNRNHMMRGPIPIKAELQNIKTA